MIFMMMMMIFLMVNMTMTMIDGGGGDDDDEITFVTTKCNRIVPEANDKKEYNGYCSHGIWRLTMVMIRCAYDTYNSP